MFILRGLTLVGLKWATGGSTQLRGVARQPGRAGSPCLFSGDGFRGVVFAWLASRDLIDKFPTGLPR